MRIKMTGAVFKVRRIDGVLVNLDLRQQADESSVDFLRRVQAAIDDVPKHRHAWVEMSLWRYRCECGEEITAQEFAEQQRMER